MKKESVDKIRLQIREGRLDETEEFLTNELRVNGEDDDIHFWLGNLYRKMNDFPKALEQYATAIELNADSPAREAHMMLMDILRFYDKERYNV